MTESVAADDGEGPATVNGNDGVADDGSDEGVDAQASRSVPTLETAVEPSTVR